MAIALVFIMEGDLVVYSLRSIRWRWKSCLSDEEVVRE